jgi:hypothetical protein
LMQQRGGSNNNDNNNSSNDGGNTGIMSKKISRREFLKIVGAAGASVALGGLAFSSLSFRPAGSNNNNNNNNLQSASAQSYGSWQLGGQTHATAIHIGALYNGKVIYVAGSGFYSQNELGPFELGVYDPSTDTATPLPNTSEDMFCVGQNMLPNGNILFTGGSLTYDDRSANGKWLGLKGAWIYDVPSNTLRRIASMAQGRWYPTQVLLSDGKVLVVGGYDEYGVYNRLTEIFDPATETWSIKYDPSSTTTYCAGAGEDPTIMPGAGQPCYGPGVAANVLLYPRMHLLPNGLVAVCGQSKTLRTFNPATGEWKFAGNMITGGRGYGTSVLLPLQNTTAETGSILIFGGTVTSDDYATNTAEILTPSGSSLVPRSTASSQYGRKHPIPVIMPDGKILAIGGTAFQNLASTKILEAELFDPVAETWTTLPAMTVPRQYHSSGVLLRDGRVWVAGTTASKTSRELRVEYFVPWYYSATRPTISGAPTVGDYGQTITIPTPDAPDIDAVSLVMLGTETHAGNYDQRLVWLQIQSKTATEVVVSAPINSKIAPPTYYYLHVLKQGVPSVAAVVKIPGTAPPPPPPPPPTGDYVNIYSVKGDASYGAMASTGASTDFTGMGERVTSASSLVGSAIKRVAVILKKSGSPTGQIFVRIRNSNGAIAQEIGTIDAATLTTADQRFELTASAQYTLKANDNILVEWYGTGSLTDVVSAKRSGVDAFDGTNTYFVARRTDGTYTTSTGRDLAGDWYRQT